jgi:hypothetical protein
MTHPMNEHQYRKEASVRDKKPTGKSSCSRKNTGKASLRSIGDDVSLAGGG